MSRFTIALAAVVVLSLSGCFYSREIAHLRGDIERLFPEARFDRQVVVALGPGTLRPLGWLADHVPEDHARMASDYMRNIERVKVGVYETEYLPPMETVSQPRLRRFEHGDWEMAAKVRDDDEVVWVFYRERYENVRDLYVIVLNDDELVLVRVQRHLNQLLEAVLEDHGPLLDFAHNL